MQEGYDGLLRDKTRPSRIPRLGSDITERVVALTQTDPPAEATHWTSAMMAKAVDISASSIQRIWRAHGLQPHRVKQFKLSTDPRFVDKLRDVVGLYVDPPAHAVVLSVDEKSQIQALDRTQPGLPMKKGRAGTMIGRRRRGLGLDRGFLHLDFACTFRLGKVVHGFLLGVPATARLQRRLNHSGKIPPSCRPDQRIRALSLTAQR